MLAVTVIYTHVCQGFSKKKNKKNYNNFIDLIEIKVK